MVVNKKWRRCKLCLGNDNIKQVDNFKYLEMILIKDEKYETEIRLNIVLPKNAFHKLSTQKLENLVSHKENSDRLLCGIRLFK